MRWIVPYSAGGGHDLDSRLWEPFLEAEIGVELVLENRPGAGGGVGARAIREADPDGSTLGIVNATALLIDGILDPSDGLPVSSDYTVLGRVGWDQPIWATSPDSPYRSVDDLRSSAAGEPILLGVSDVVSPGFAFVSVPAELLGLQVVYLAGYAGSREYSLGLIRNEFDVGGFSLPSVLDQIEAGDLIPVLQVSDTPFSEHPDLGDVPVWAGSEGLAARWAEERGEDPRPVVSQASALLRMFEAGRLIVAPSGLSDDVAQCLSTSLAKVATDPKLREQAITARRPVDFAGPAQVLSLLDASLEDRATLASILQRHSRWASGQPSSHDSR